MTSFFAASQGDVDDVHRGAYRIFCVLAGLLSPLFGIVYHLTDPTALDPLWARFGLAVVALLLLSLSYMSEWVKSRFIGLVQMYFYLLFIYVVALTAVNGFSPQYTIGLMFALTAMGVAFSLGLRKQMKPLQEFLAFAVIITVPVGLMVSMPEVSLILVWICALSTAFVIHVAAGSRIKAEESMEASEQRYHTLMSAASDAIFIADPGSGMLIDANRKAQELIGQPLDAIQRMRTAELFPEADRERYTSLFESYVFKNEPISEDLFVVHRTGEGIPIDVSASLIDVGGRKFIQGIFRRHRYEQQLIQAKERAEELLQVKSSLLNNISHELRTPLTSILGYAEMMCERGNRDPDECAEVIITSAKRLRDTLNSILSFAQLDSGQTKLDLAPINVAPQVCESVVMLKPLAEQKRIDLYTEVLSDDAHALASEVCLHRIVTNLVDNAIKFTSEGYVLVEIDADHQSVYIRVRDTGIGIGEPFQPKLFQEFRQESTGLARTYEGTGLGLAITKRLVDLLQGTITVESTKGVGSVFTVALPHVSTQGLHAEASALAGASGTAAQKRVLVLEDSPDTQALIVQRLESLFAVEAASEPQAALSMAEESHFDGFFVDINLGGPQDGLDFMRAIRQIPRYARTPIVALTAYAMPGDREHFLQEGFDFYISKPFTRKQLLDVAHVALDPEPARHGLAITTQL